MNRAEEILKEQTLNTLNINEGSPLHEAVIKAMKEYAKECMENSLKLASENREIFDSEEYFFQYVTPKSIVNSKNIVLL